MNDNFKLLKNYILYFLLMILVFIVGVSGVFAETLTGMKFANRNIGQFPFSTSYEPYTYTADYFTFNGQNGSPNYAILDTCATGPLDFSITNSSGIFKYIGYVEMSNKPCTTQGYNGYEYIYYFNFVQFTDAGNGNVGVTFNNRISNLYNYTTYVTFKSMTFSDTSNLDILQQQQVLINQNSQNTNNIINNQNQNTDSIINNQNQNTQEQIESQQVCNTFLVDNTDIISSGRYLDSSGVVSTGWAQYGITDYIELSAFNKIKVLSTYSSDRPYHCFYNSNKTFISCIPNNSLILNDYLNIPNGSKYVRFTIINSSNAPTFEISSCKNGNQALDDSINNLNDNLNDDDSSGATSEASDFFSNFTTNTFGLTSIITAPLNLIQSITSSTCTDLPLPLPYLNNKYLDLPCMTTIYSTYFGSFFTIYQTITFGIIAYWVCVRVFNLVKDFKNPEHDEIEVLDL